MRTRQNNKLRMFRTIEKVLDDNPSVWNGLPGFVNIKNSFSSLIEQLLTTIGQQNEVTTGITTDKNNLKIAMIRCAVPLAAHVFVHAVQTGNYELRDAVNFSYTKLFRLRSNSLLGQCRNILMHANANMAALAVYNISSIQLQQLEQAINAYAAKMPEVTVALVLKKTATKKLAQLFAQTDILLKLELDKIVEITKAHHLQFYEAYKAARHIRDLGTHHTSLRVMVKDANGHLLSGASVSLLHNNEIVYTKTTEVGLVNLSRVSPGIYNLRIEMPGFAAHIEMDVMFTPGKRTGRIVVLKGT